MKYNLVGIRATVDDQAVTTLGDTFFVRDGVDHFEHVPRELLVFFGDLIHSWNVFFRNDQDVGRCNGVDIPECENLLILIDNCRWNLPIDDFAEDTFGMVAMTDTLRRQRLRIFFVLMWQVMSKLELLNCQEQISKNRSFGISDLI